MPKQTYPSNTRSKRIKNKFQLVIIEDNRLLREAIVANFRQCHDVYVTVALANRQSNGLKACASPDVVLLGPDLRLLRTARRELPKAKLVVMNLSPAEEGLSEFVKAGTLGFIFKEATGADFLKTVRSVVQGVKLLPPFAEVKERAATSDFSEASRLTRRERELIALIVRGLSNKEIAQRLSVGLPTVQSHVHHILAKLALRHALRNRRLRQRENVS